MVKCRLLLVQGFVCYRIEDLTHRSASGQHGCEFRNILGASVWHPESTHILPSYLLCFWQLTWGIFFFLFPLYLSLSSFYLIYRFLAKCLPELYFEADTLSVFKISTYWTICFLQVPFFPLVSFLSLRAASLKSHSSCNRMCPVI